ncbi:SagB/ThcOx family dehydrogenase [Piscinibacter sp. XHJ-5]|uniref:SagB/ThcOx family dehydrogenase n=1 Tax=Piscinibacter sp. XHJ-5 TaxID=3037797 RepID=UPI002452A4E0|nr:SagB/ThcOx family dehydrogenase [Piscinibacter sp. XHJ-5]
MNGRARNDLAQAAPAGEALAAVVRYHQQTKHHFLRHARSPGMLDWANQPDPFRRYTGSPLVALPRLKPDDEPASPPYEDLYRDGAIASAALTAATLSRFLECSLAISAWKQAGDVRWALRANPSSGNLHPTEAYLLIDEVEGVGSAPGLYHYASKEHALELRAEWQKESFQPLLRAFPRRAFLLGFTSVHWRESWKYGERAFRYCQHDVGHAIGSARIAAQMLGWRMLLLDGMSDHTVARLLGVDRDGDFEKAEREHPDCLAVIWPADESSSLAAPQAVSLPLFLDADAAQAPPRRWHGRANRLSRADPVHWDIIRQVEAASWKTTAEFDVVALHGDHRWVEAPADTSALASAVSHPPGQRAAQLIRQRRSALAFDATTSVSADSFFTMLLRVMPQADRAVCQRPMPWDALPWAPSIHLALFVHRVDGLAPGLYILARDASKIGWLRRATYRQYSWSAPPDCPRDLPLFLLQQADVRALAAQLSCGQEIAGDGAFSLGMIAEFESSLRQRGPWFYRRLFWETGVIGQLLYVEAEAIGLRATGIGCFFDDPVHEVMGFSDTAFQSLYHFTVGGAVEDPRLTTLPPYGV